ncbi:MAG: glycosyltransferase [Solirubrobacteraceae bacterium]
MTALQAIFWLAVGLLVYTQVGYGVLLALLCRLPAGRARSVPDGLPGPDAAARPDATHQLPPPVTAIIAAYNEQDLIAQRIANLRALEDPGGRLQVIVASDGSSDQTVARARAAGADLVLDLPRAGKICAQDAAVGHAAGEILVFSDANAQWQPDALAKILAAFAADTRVGYVCGQVTFTDAHGTNQEGLYWRYEMWLRAMESRLYSVTSGNGAIYATRRDTYIHVDPIAGHDLSFPFRMVKRGLRAVYVPQAHATEKMAPTLEGEFARKRRMARRTWPSMWRGGLVSPRGYPPRYALMIFSHRILRYLVPFLHVLALTVNLVLLRTGNPLYYFTLAVQLALLASAALARRLPARPLLIARYYVVTNAALAAGLWDWLRGERSATWETVEGTR